MLPHETWINSPTRERPTTYHRSPRKAWVKNHDGKRWQTLCLCSPHERGLIKWRRFPAALKMSLSPQSIELKILRGVLPFYPKVLSRMRAWIKNPLPRPFFLTAVKLSPHGGNVISTAIRPKTLRWCSHAQKRMWID